MQIDKIMVSKALNKCTVYMVNGPSLTFDFNRLKMTLEEGISWVIDEVLNGAKAA